MTGRWFFVALPLAALSVALGGHFWGGSALFLLSLGRVAALRTPKIWWLAVGLALCFGIVSGVRQQRLSHRRLSVTTPTRGQLRLRVQPDSVTFRGASYQALGQKATGEWVLLRGQAKSPAELTRLQGLTQATLWTVLADQQGILPAPNFSQFDAAAYWRRRNIVNTVKLLNQPQLQPATRSLWQWWPDWWHGWRSRAIRACNRLPGALKVYALGLFPGSRASEAADELAGMQRLGVIHLFAISGLHVVLLLAVAEWVAVHCHLPREWWEWGMILGLPGYAIFAGGGSGVLRACWSRGTQLLAQRLHGTLDALDAWTLAFIVGVWQNPGLLFELGSQLSYGLSLGLLLLRRESPRWRQIGLTLLSLPSLLTGIFQWHGLTLFANWLVVPLFPVIILPVTAVGTLLGPHFSALATGCAHVLGGFDTILGKFAGLPGNILFGRPFWWIAWGWVAATWWLFSRPVPQRRRWLVVLLASYVVAFGLIHLPWRGEVTYFDVGQGDSILIRTPFNRRVTLIDTGGHLAFPQPAWVPRTPPTYAATQTSVTYLKSRGITRIDDLYLTHHDVDHIGDLPAILANFRVAQLLVPAGMEREAAWQRVLKRWPRVRIRPIRVGVPGTLRVEHPFQAGVADNGGSLALSGRFGGRDFLFMGDLDQAGERRILAAQPALRADVLKLGHHGSKTASAPDFIAQIRPRLAVISAGRHNRYGHPNAETLATLQRARIPAVSTQTSGMVHYTYGAHSGRWETKLHLKE